MFEYISVGQLIVYLVGFGIFFYLSQGFEGFMNGADYYPHPRWQMPFRYFWGNLILNIPGGTKRKEKLIRKIVSDKYAKDWWTLTGDTREWKYSEIRERNLYRECAKDYLVSPLEFWSGALVPVLWPLLVAFWVVSIVAYGLWSAFRKLVPKRTNLAL